MDPAITGKLLYAATYGKGNKICRAFTTNKITEYPESHTKRPLTDLRDLDMMAPPIILYERRYLTLDDNAVCPSKGHAVLVRKERDETFDKAIFYTP